MLSPYNRIGGFIMFSFLNYGRCRFKYESMVESRKTSVRILQNHLAIQQRQITQIYLAIASHDNLFIIPQLRIHP
jgi:hypothetical protein